MISLKKHIINIFSYETWANQTLLKNLSQLSDEEFKKSISVPFHNIHGIVQHLYYYQEKYYRKIVEDNHEKFESKLSRTDLTNQLTSRSTDWLAWSHQSDMQITDKQFQDLLNLTMHNSYHRGQIQTVISFFGYRAESLDIFYYQDNIHSGTEQL